MSAESVRQALGAEYGVWVEALQAENEKLRAERTTLIEALERIESILDSDRGGEPYARGQCIGIVQAALAAARAGER